MDWLLYLELVAAPAHLIRALRAADSILEKYGADIFGVGLPELELYLDETARLYDVGGYMAVGAGYIDELHQRGRHIRQLGRIALDQVLASGHDLDEETGVCLQKLLRTPVRRTEQHPKEPDEVLDEIRVPDCLRSLETESGRALARRWESMCAATAALQDMVDEIGEAEEALLKICRQAMRAARELFAEEDGLCGWWGIRLRDARAIPRDVFEGR